MQNYATVLCQLEQFDAAAEVCLKGLALDVTMEDPKVFTAPLTARVTYRPLISQWQESVCADNPIDHYEGEWIGLPKADRSDF